MWIKKGMIVKNIALAILVMFTVMLLSAVDVDMFAISENGETLQSDDQFVYVLTQLYEEEELVDEVDADVEIVTIEDEEVPMAPEYFTNRNRYTWWIIIGMGVLVFVTGTCFYVSSKDQIRDSGIMK